MDMGMVKAKIISSGGEMVTIMAKLPTTVIRLERICVRSVERDAPTVSTS